MNLKHTLATVSLVLAVTVGCGSSQEPAEHSPSVPGVDAGDADQDSGRISPDSGREAAVYADSGHDADNPADPVNSCFDCPPGQIQECAILCTQIGGYIAGDGEPYQCCHW